MPSNNVTSVVSINKTSCVCTFYPVAPASQEKASPRCPHKSPSSPLFPTQTRSHQLPDGTDQILFVSSHASWDIQPYDTNPSRCFNRTIAESQSIADSVTLALGSAHSSVPTLANVHSEMAASELACGLSQFSLISPSTVLTTFSCTVFCSRLYLSLLF